MTKKEKNAAKDPNKPKRPPSAFFVFMYTNPTLVDFIHIFLIIACFVEY